ncbi:nucleotidyltransferase domain-containing protein [Candidatus Micrarchaeota archaeon]|nr:nucleotidyltransferase domain-containing protein [Candidatus Micrarchaeota archaeon]
MGKKDSLIKMLSQFKKSVSSVLPIEEMILFGSFARGDYKKDSDVDLIVVSPKFKQVLFSRRNSKLYDHWVLDYPVDFLCFSPEEFKKLKKQVSIVSMAIKEGVEIN